MHAPGAPCDQGTTGLSLLPCEPHWANLWYNRLSRRQGSAPWSTASPWIPAQLTAGMTEGGARGMHSCARRNCERSILSNSERMRAYEIVYHVRGIGAKISIRPLEACDNNTRLRPLVARGARGMPSCARRSPREPSRCDGRAPGACLCWQSVESTAPLRTWNVQTIAKG